MFCEFLNTSAKRVRVPNRLRARLFCQRLETRLAPATFAVTNNADSGLGSLRGALSSANGSAGADTIDLLGVSGTITLTSAELTISEAVTITGPGPGLLSINGNNAYRVFNMQTAAAKAVMAISGVTITGGKVTGSGGAIYVGDEFLTLTNCAVTGSTATSRGGGVYMRYAGSVTIQSCTISNNSATGDGGGISNRVSAPITVLNSTISGNTCNVNGGGINLYSPGVLFVEGCTILNNKAGNVGGGFLFRGTGAANELIVRNCTITGNTAPRGGGINLSTPFLVTIQNTTITGNTASTRGAGIAVTNPYANGTTNLESTIVSGNVNAAGPDISGYYASNPIKVKNCAIGSNVGFTMTDLGGNLPFGANLKLGSLASNGGPTQTQLPAFDSPLINAGTNPAGLTTDQRGAGYVRTSGGATDIGAVEIPTFAVTNDKDSGTGSLRKALDDSNALAPSPDIITFDPTFFAIPRTINLAGGELSISDALTIIGPGSTQVTINGASAGRVFNVNGGTGSIVVRVSGVTISGGQTAGPGGGIFNQDEALTLTDCAITGNQSSQAGGGIFVQSGAGSLTLLRCTVSNNQVTAGIGQKAGDGGAIDLIGNSIVVIDASSITGNTAKESGGGLYFFSGGTLTLTNSTISGNVAKAGSGGGVYFIGSAVALTIRNSTLSGNIAQLNGGALYLSNFTGTASIQNSTLTNNTATTGAGGGIARGPGSGIIALESTIVSGNMSPISPDIDSAGSVTGKNSAIGSNTGFTLSSLGGNLAFGADLKLGPLANNGGPTQTHLPLAGSPLINVGSNPASLTTDQRGLPRTVLGQIDIGAIEVQDLVVTNVNNSGPGTLRQAIADANTLFAGANTITFEAGFFATARTITLTSGEIAIIDSLTIIGTGSAKLTVSGNNSSRIFSIDKSSSPGNLIAFSGMTFTAGKSTAVGGAIFNADESLTMTDCVVTGNQSSVSGGGIFVQSGLGSLTLQDCTLSKNQVTAGVGLKLGDGGGINLQGASKVTIDRCTLSGNTANENGGAIYFYQGGSLTLTNSTISGNSAKTLQGGGIFFYGAVAAGGFTIRNSTLAGNSAKTSGGGICFVNITGSCVIQNSTIADNTAQNGFGGGITRSSGTGSVALESSIVSGNLNVNAPDIYSNGSIFAKFCAFGNGTGFTFTDQGNNLAIPANVKLGPLANNGGPTQTMALATGSPGMDAGSNPASLSTDQRGAGFPRSFGTAPDIGAFEYLAAAPRVNSFAINDGAAQRSRVINLTINFDSLVTLPAAPATAFQLVRQSDGAPVTLEAAATNTTFTSVNLTFTGGPVESGSLADGRYTLSALANSIFGLGGALDGNSDGTNGDNYVLVGDPATNKLFRLYGDSDGNGTINQADFNAFRAAYNNGPSITFDINGDGQVDQTDFIQFRNHFNLTV